MIAAYTANRAARQGNSDDSVTLNRMTRMLGKREFPETLPAYNDLRVDSEGLIWVRAYVLPGVTTATWSIFDADGLLLAELDVPAALRVLDVGRNHLLALARDSLDVEQVRYYTISR
jgi:hypothetical protein